MRVGLRRRAAVGLVALLVAACGTGKATPRDGSNGSGGTGGSGAESKRAFVSYDMLQGNMGVVGADAACQKDADVWFQGHTFRAWISTSTEGALARVGQGPWFVGSERLGTAAELAANQLGTPFNRSATGSVFATGEYAWTGTVSGGTAASTTCADWSSKDLGLTGLVGQINYAGEKWTAATTPTCDHDGHLYCLEQ